MKVSLQYNLLTTNPRLSLEWHPTKNLNLTPTTITPGSGKKVWWRCTREHEWEATVSSRVAGRGCSLCSGRKASKDSNLATTHPLLARQWHPTLNGDLKATDVVKGSNRRVWWLCPKGHEWDTVIAHRVRSRSGCSHCSNRRVNQENCLATLNPKLAKEWHPTLNSKLTPKDVTAGTYNKVWWMCEKRHEWKATVGERNSRGRGCPYCCGQKTAIEDSLFNLMPDLAKEWHPTLNKSFTPKDCRLQSNKKAWWFCSKGHNWEARIVSRVAKGSGCPSCSGRRATEDTCLLASHPTIAKEWHPARNGKLTPRDVKRGTHKKVWWICKNDHEWETTPETRTSGSNCPKCNIMSSKLELQIFCELKYVFDDTKLKEKINGHEIDIYIPSLHFGIELDGVYWHKNKRVQDIEKTMKLKGHGVDLLRLREKGLKAISENDIIHPIRANVFSLMEEIYRVLLKNYPLAASRITAINKYIQGRKAVNHSEYTKLLYMLPGPTLGESLTFKNPKLAKELHPTKNGKLQASGIHVSSNKKVWWICQKGHEWDATVNHRTSGTGCPICSGHLVVEETSLAVIRPDIAKQWHPTLNDLKPEEVHPSSNRKYWWICEKGHKWEAAPNHRKRGQGCPYCSGKRVCIDNCLQTVNPKLTSEWDDRKNGDLSPKNVTRGTHKKVWWRCKGGHSWQASVVNRTKGRGCPECRKLKNRNHVIK